MGTFGQRFLRRLREKCQQSCVVWWHSLFLACLENAQTPRSQELFLWLFNWKNPNPYRRRRREENQCLLSFRKIYWPKVGRPDQQIWRRVQNRLLSKENRDNPNNMGNFSIRSCHFWICRNGSTCWRKAYRQKYSKLLRRFPYWSLDEVCRQRLLTFKEHGKVFKRQIFPSCHCRRRSTKN